jgi:very-short-patch-repair endonuclease
MTPAEQTLWTRLEGNRLWGVHFRRQQPIDRYIADFFCMSLKLVIELDGAIHETQQEHDASRDAHFRSLGLTVMRVPNEDVLPRPGPFIRRLRQWIETHHPDQIPPEYRRDRLWKP